MGDDFEKFLKVAKSLFNVTISDNGYILDTPLDINKGVSSTSPIKKKKSIPKKIKGLGILSDYSHLN